MQVARLPLQWSELDVQELQHRHQQAAASQELRVSTAKGHVYWLTIRRPVADHRCCWGSCCWAGSADCSPHSITATFTVALSLRAMAEKFCFKGMNSLVNDLNCLAF